MDRHISDSQLHCDSGWHYIGFLDFH